MANMTFKANLLPSSNLGYNLGSSSLKWNVYGDLKGNADTATALTSNAGSSTVPIYFSNGKPVQCSTTLGVSITGNAVTATKLSNTPNNTTTFLRGDNTWTNILTGTFQSGPITITPENTTSEGGQITLKADPNHPNYDGNLDVYNNYFRLFSSGGEKFKINLTDASLYNYGNVDIKGDFFVHNDASLRIYSQTNSQNYTGGNNENVCIQTCFDDQDPKTHSHVTSYENRCNLVLQPRGGQVYIGNNLTNLGDTNYSLLVTGNQRIAGHLKISWANHAYVRHIDGCADSDDHDLFLQHDYNAHTYIRRGPNNTIIDVNPDGSIYMYNKTVFKASSNPSGNSMGQGVHIWDDNEGGNIRIYSGNCTSNGAYGSYYWEIDAYNGNLRCYNIDSSGNYHGSVYIGKTDGVLHGACWNDYAEFRETCQEAKPGQCVIENGDDTLSLSIKRCQPGAQIVSDTYGFAIGEVEGKYETPLAVSGRVLAYTDVDRYKFKPGQAVCSGPNGTVSRMRWYEKILWPERIIGFVSAIPEYEEWGNINAEVKVDSRIWIRIK